MKEYKTIDLFAGIGGIRLGFEAFGCKTYFHQNGISMLKVCMK